MELESFFARTTKITGNGIRWAIQYLKNLQYLDSVHLSRANFDRRNIRVCLPKMNLKSFHFRRDGYLKLEHVVEFPNGLRQKIISNSGYVENLATAYDTRTLFTKEQEPNYYNISFPIDVVPFLTRFGKYAQDILLQEMKEVDILFVMSACPLLRQVDFFFCKMKASRIPRPPVSHNLEICKIRDGRSVGKDELLYLLLSPNLREIYIHYSPSFCDEVLEAAFRQTRFRNLERLYIRNCPLSKPIFSLCFMSESNALTLVEIYGCSSLCTRENVKEWLSIAASRNWDIKIVIK